MTIRQIILFTHRGISFDLQNDLACDLAKRLESGVLVVIGVDVVSLRGYTCAWLPYLMESLSGESDDVFWGTVVVVDGDWEIACCRSCGGGQ